MSKTRKNQRTVPPIEVQFAIWLKKQVLMAGQYQDLQRRFEALEAKCREMAMDMKVVTEHMLGRSTRHIPPEVLNPKSNAPVQPPAVHG